MYDDDSRGLESPDRPHASTTNTRVHSSQSEADDPVDASDRLERIDYQAKKLLESVYTHTETESHDAVRHLREIRAEVECASRLLGDAGLSDGSPKPDARGADSSDPTENEPSGDKLTESEPIEDDSTDPESPSIPMIVHRGPFATTVLGPDPIAFERTYGRGREHETGDRDEE